MRILDTLYAQVNIMYNFVYCHEMNVESYQSFSYCLVS